MSSRLLSVALTLAVAGAGLAVAPAPSPAPAPARAPIDLRSGEYVVDGGHSMVIFSIRHAGVANFYGRFNTVTGNVSLDAESAANSSVLIQIDPASVDSNSNGRDDHIQSPDFLNTAEHTELSFRSQKVEATEGGGFEVTGPLSVAGVTKTITVPVEVVGAAETMFGDFRMGLEARFAIDRREYGMTALQGGLGNDIEFIVSLETILRAEEGGEASEGSSGGPRGRRR